MDADHPQSQFRLHSDLPGNTTPRTALSFGTGTRCILRQELHCISDLSVYVKDCSIHLDHALQRTSLTLVKFVQTPNKFEAWKMWSQRYATFGHIPRPTVGANFFGDFQSWETGIAEPERNSGTVLSDSVRILILQIEISGQRQQHFRSDSHTIIRSLLIDCHQATLAFTTGTVQTQTIRL